MVGGGLSDSLSLEDLLFELNDGTKTFKQAASLMAAE